MIDVKSMFVNCVAVEKFQLKIFLSIEKISKEPSSQYCSEKPRARMWVEYGKDVVWSQYFHLMTNRRVAPGTRMSGGAINEKIEKKSINIFELFFLLLSATGRAWAGKWGSRALWRVLSSYHIWSLSTFIWSLKTSKLKKRSHFGVNQQINQLPCSSKLEQRY